MESKSTYPSFVVPETRPFRRFVAKFMLAVPAMLTLAVAVQTKPDPDGFEYHSQDQTMNNIINGYVPVMQKTGWLTEARTTTPDQIREASDIWWKEWSEKKVQAIPRTKYDEMVYDGVTGQIVRTVADINFKMLNVAQGDYERQDYKSAMQDGLSALRMSQVLRDSDMLLNSVMDVRERRVLDLLDKTSAHLSESDRKAFAAQLRTFRTDGPSLGSLLSRTYSLYLRDLAASGSTNTFLEGASPKIDHLPSVSGLRQLPSNESAVAVLNEMKSQVRDAMGDAPRRPFDAQLIRTLDNQTQTQRQLEALIARNEA